MFTFGDPGIGGGGVISVPGGGGIFIPDSNPTPSSSGGGASNPSGSWLSQLLPWASLGAQTFLADQAITSPRPSTITYLPNGQLAASGGGAAPLNPSGLGSSSNFLTFLGTSAGLLFIVGLVVIIFVLKK